MTLDDLEQLALRIESSVYHNDKYGEPTEACVLARAILGMLPVARKAEAWRDTVQSGHVGKHDENMNSLIAAIDAWRRDGGK